MHLLGCIFWRCLTANHDVTAMSCEQCSCANISAESGQSTRRGSADFHPYVAPPVWLFHWRSVIGSRWVASRDSQRRLTSPGLDRPHYCGWMTSIRFSISRTPGSSLISNSLMRRWRSFCTAPLRMILRPSASTRTPPSCGWLTLRNRLAAD